MTQYIFSRLITLPILLLVASFIIFCLPYMTGIDPTRAIIRARIGERTISDEAMERLTDELGLNDPIIVQYGDWLGRMATGDLGYSYVSRTPVLETLRPAAKATAFLAGSAIGLSLILSIPLGLIAAYRQGSWLDRIITLLTQLGIVIPNYWLAPVLVLLFSLSLGWLPSAGWREPAHYILPIATLSSAPSAYFTRITRSTVIEVLLSDYIRTAHAKGLREIHIAIHHALRNALIPILTIASVWLASLLGGTVIVEVIFAIPGLGSVLYSATLASDVPLLQAGILLLFGAAVIINTCTDILYAFLNPTIRLGTSKL